MKAIHLFLLLFTPCVLHAQSFLEVIERLSELPSQQQQEYFESYLENEPSLPLRKGNEVIIITKSQENPPLLLADFNGFLNPRYIKDKSIGLMKPVGTTSWYYFRKELVPDAVINYKFSNDSNEWIDSLNPNKRTSFGDTVSFIRMGAQPEAIKAVPEEKRGKVVTMEFKSKIQSHTRTILVYTPSNYAELNNLPMVYFHDGSFFTDEMKVPEILDNLIAGGQMEPVVAVFDNPFARGKEYNGDSLFVSYIENELVPFISGNYKVNNAKDGRAVIGFSRGGMSAIRLGYVTDLFSMVGALSPAIYPTNVEDFMRELIQFPGQPNYVFITGTLYDHLWYRDAGALQKSIVQQGIKIDYIENPEGHNVLSWQTQIDDMLIGFFGK